MFPGVSQLNLRCAQDNQEVLTGHLTSAGVGSGLMVREGSRVVAHFLESLLRLSGSASSFLPSWFQCLFKTWFFMTKNWFSARKTGPSRAPTDLVCGSLLNLFEP